MSDILWANKIAVIQNELQEYKCFEKKRNKRKTDEKNLNLFAEMFKKYG